MGPGGGEVGGSDGGPMGRIGDVGAVTLAGESVGNEVEGVVGLDAAWGVDGRDEETSIFSAHIAFRSRKINKVINGHTVQRFT